MDTVVDGNIIADETGPAGVELTWRDARRSRMLAAASRVFARASFEQASMDEIAHEAEVGKPTLYRYFPSKDALFAAVFEHALDDLEERLARVLGEVAGARERLAALVAEIIPTLREHLVSLRFLGDTAAGAGHSKRRVFRERRTRIATYLGRAIDGGVASGEMRAVDGARVGHILIGMLWSATANSGLADDDIVGDVIDLVMNGLAPRVAAGPRDAWPPGPSAAPADPDPIRLNGARA